MSGVYVSERVQGYKYILLLGLGHIGHIRQINRDNILAESDPLRNAIEKKFLAF